ncbi:MAG TPA: ABC transporter ATP-binding protein [Lachnospiraceae bacterium]|nr:ABC transporter ATP-binding protein [Lachnospiraceae bacterium]
MKEIKLPKEIWDLLQTSGITKKDVCFCAPTDLNDTGEYVDGFLVLTEEKLFCLKATAYPGRIQYFKGFEFKDQMNQEYNQEWSIQEYFVKEIDRMWIEPQVSCNLLLIKIEDLEICVSVFSNLHKSRAHSLIRKFDHRGDENQLEVEEEDEYCPKCGRMYIDKSRKICTKCMDRKSIFIRVLGYFKPHSRMIGVMFACILASTSLNLVWPYLNGTILYDGILSKNEQFLLKYGIKNGNFITALFLVVLTMFVTKLVLLLFQIIQGVLTAKMVTNVVCTMKKDVFQNMGKLSIQFYKSRQTGSLMTRVMSDAERVTGFFFDGLPYLFINGFIILASVCVMLSINWQMTIMTILLLPVLTVISLYLRPKIWVMFGKRHRAERSLNGLINDNLTGARVVKSFGREKNEVERFHGYNHKLKEAEISIAYRQNYFRFVYGAAQEIANIAVWSIGVYFLMNGKNMNVGTIITFAGYVGQLSGPMGFFSRVFNWWADSMNSAQRMFEIMDAIPDISEKEHPIALKNPRGEVTLKNVTFGYEENRPILKNINFHVPEGSMLGIVGHSGAGKTTIVNLISRMYDPQEGCIMIDGNDIRDLSFHDLRKNVAMVSQETYVFMGTVAENIAYANPEASLEDIMKAAKLAGAHDFIMRMSDAYDTTIGASGRELSGGERQRISIARAILANPKILILDEATASVDTETERIIQKSINYLIKGRTTISIAHRLSTLRDADYLVVIEQGVITERGTQTELAALKGTYSKLLGLQTEALELKGTL